MDLFKHPRQDMSDDEREDDDESEKEENNPGQFASIAITIPWYYYCTFIVIMAFFWNYCIFVTIFLFLSDDPDASNGSKSTRAERARKKKSEANSNADKNKDSATDGKNNKNNKNGEDKKDVVTEADIKIEPDKSGRRTPLHARDMDPVSCSNFTNFFSCVGIFVF